MKNITIQLVALFFLSIAIISCGGDDYKADMSFAGDVSFGVQIVDKNTGGRVMSGTPSAIKVTIENSSGDEVYSLEEISLTEFSGDYVSSTISLLAGNYTITEYLVTESSGSSIYATPQEGSEFAHLVSDPLPISFTISSDAVNKVTPQVISTSSQTPADFGYSHFQLDTVTTFDFLVAAFVLETVNLNYELTTADVVITDGSTTLYSGTLAAETNQIRLSDVYANYTVTVSKSGYTSVVSIYTKSELEAYFIDPLEVTLVAE